MLDETIQEDLLKFTEEEINALNGHHQIDNSIYLDDKTIDYGKLLGHDENLGIRKHTRFMAYPLHKHNYIELIYVYEGQMTTHIDENTITLRKGQLLLINQNIEHSIDFTGENDLIFNFIIKKEMLSFLTSLIEDDNQLNDFVFHSLYSYENIGEYLLFEESSPLVTNYIESIITHLYHPTLNNKVELKLLLGLLMSELMNHPEAIVSYAKKTYEKVELSKVYKYIAMNYAHASLQELANQMHMSDYKLSKFIKKMTNQTFMSLLKEERFRHCEQLLKTSHYTIEEIITLVGYENESYFYRTFKQKYHMTPKQYRESLS